MARPSYDEVVERILDELERYPDGVHRLNEPAYLLDSEIPESLAELYRGFDGGDIFHEAMTVYPSAQLVIDGDRFRVGQVGGELLWVDRGGAVWRRDAEGGPVLPEASAFDRWLSGFLDAEALVVDPEGEFRDGVFTDSGELEPAVAIERERAMIKRDRKAAGPHYRLGLLLVESGETARARECFEEAVSAAAEHSFAWVELSKISQQLGDDENALEEMVEAATAAEKGAGEFVPLLWAGAARIAAELGDADRQRECAARALEAEPQLVDQLCRGAESELAEGYPTEAAGLLALARPLAPRHLRVLDLCRRIDDEQSSPGGRERPAETGDKD